MKSSLKNIYLRLIIVCIIFIIISSAYFLSFKFFKQKLAQKIEEINDVKQKNLNLQSRAEYLIKQRQMVKIFEQKSGKSLDETLNVIEKNLNKKSEEVNKIINDKQWQIIENRMDEFNNLKLSLFLKPEEIHDFFDFLVEQWLFLKISTLKVVKNDQSYNINLVIKIEK